MIEEIRLLQEPVLSTQGVTLEVDVEAGLPDYARPVFVRLCPALPETGTHKLTKLALVHEGFDPAVVGDPLFMRVDGAYVPLDAARFSTLGVRHPPARGETP